MRRGWIPRGGALVPLCREKLLAWEIGSVKLTERGAAPLSGAPEKSATIAVQRTSMVSEAESDPAAFETVSVAVKVPAEV